ncbi:MAG: metal-dependent hydrolase [Campylobacterales bacterium]
MKLLHANYLITMDEREPIVREAGILFDDRIIEIGAFDELRRHHPKAHVVRGEGVRVAFPSLINSHTHFEFVATDGGLTWGRFIDWLYSVIAQRERITKAATPTRIKQAARAMVATGTGTALCVSSYGEDLRSLVQTPLRLLFAPEGLGTKPEAIEALKADYHARIDTALALSSRLKPLIAVHSPYAVHPELLDELVAIAHGEGLMMTAHLLESPEERIWLDRAEGAFAKFFADFLGQTKPMMGALEFIRRFKGIKTLFVHATQASEDELALIAAQGGAIVHCPISNRLLGCGRLDLLALRRHHIPWMLGSDGLSSSWSLSLFEQMRAALMMHHDEEASRFAWELLEAATRTPARYMGLDGGVIRPGAVADIAVATIAAEVEPDAVALALITQTERVAEHYIGGVRHA